MVESHRNSKSAADSAYLGIDVGGTDVKLGVISAEGKLMIESRMPTADLQTPENVFRAARQFVTDALAMPSLSGYRLSAVGLAVPGVLDVGQAVIREVVNLNGWLGVPLRDELRQVFPMPVSVTNDANAAAFAEHSLRRLGNQSLALVTLGTGIGCGMVVSGEPYGGDHGCAGELGHITIDFSENALPCTCGSRGHLETYAGAIGVISRMRTALQNYDAVDRSDAAEMLNTELLTPLMIATAAETGDPLCQQMIVETAMFVGRAIGLLGQVANPAVVLLGGAMTFGGQSSKVGRQFLQSVRAAVKQTTLVQVGENMTIDFASLGNQAGTIGAAMVAKELSTKASSEIANNHTDNDTDKGTLG